MGLCNDCNPRTFLEPTIEDVLIDENEERIRIKPVEAADSGFRVCHSTMFGSEVGIPVDPATVEVVRLWRNTKRTDCVTLL